MRGQGLLSLTRSERLLIHYCTLPTEPMIYEEIASEPHKMWTRCTLEVTPTPGIESGISGL